MLFALAIFLFVAIGAATAAGAAALAMKLWRVRQDATEAWADRNPDAREYAGLDETAFRRAYFRAHGPRATLHGLAGVLAAALVTFPALALLGAAWRVGWRLAGEPLLYREGYLIWQFYLFFGLIGSWVLVAALLMRRYHRNRPRELRHELARERERAGPGGRAGG